VGRPRGSKNKKTLQKQQLENEYKEDTRTDDEILDDIRTRFDIYHTMIKSAGDGDAITALIVSGSAGVGKSYTAKWALDNMKRERGIRPKIVRGTISALDLYELAYNYRHSNDVIVLDDADRIFEDEEGLNILKCLLDTSLERKVNWMTDHPRFKGENALDKEFTFRGSMIFLTNKNFQEYVDLDRGKFVEHMKALMSRSIYLDLMMHNRRQVVIWTKHLVLRNGILRRIGLTGPQEIEVVEWLLKYRDDLRELSIRTAIKLGKLLLMDRVGWEKTAEILLLREVPEKVSKPMLKVPVSP